MKSSSKPRSVTQDSAHAVTAAAGSLKAESLRPSNSHRQSQAPAAGFLLQQARFGERIAHETVAYYQRLQRAIRHPSAKNQQSAAAKLRVVIRLLNEKAARRC